MTNKIIHSRGNNKQGGNSNLDCVPRTAVVAMSDGGGEGEGGSLVQTLSTRCATRGERGERGGGGGVLSSNFVHEMTSPPPPPGQREYSPKKF